MDALFLAQVDNLLLGQRRVVLDLVDGGDDGGVWEELFQVAFAVLCWKLERFVFFIRREGGRTLDTPMALVLPVPISFSICFHVSTWLCE